MNDITKEMIDELNKALETMSLGIRIKLEERLFIEGHACDIILANNFFIESYILNLSDEFYEMLEKFFKKYGITLSYNNNRSTFWSKNFKNSNKE